MSVRSSAALSAGGFAVVTGGASGIGLAAAKAFAARGMRVALVDLPGQALSATVDEIGSDKAFACPADVADANAVERLAQDLLGREGPPAVLMNNAGIGGGGEVLGDLADWSRVLGVNMLGVLHGVKAFVPAMIASGGPGLVINTGSKQGINQPPGNTAYNVSKSGVKAITEGLAHTLLQKAGDRVTAHLLVPGFTYTGMTAAGRTEQPDAAWSPEQVVDLMLERLNAGDFYILCPDNETSLEEDKKRIAWAAGDLIENRPALSRWHPGWKGAYERFMAG